MFAPRYFAGRYFPQTFFPVGGQSAVAYFPHGYFCRKYYADRYFPGGVGPTVLKPSYFVHSAFARRYFADRYFPGVQPVFPPPPPPQPVLQGGRGVFRRIQRITGTLDLELQPPRLTAIGYLTEPAPIPGQATLEVPAPVLQAQGRLQAAPVAGTLDGSFMVTLDVVGLVLPPRRKRQTDEDEDLYLYQLALR